MMNKLNLVDIIALAIVIMFGVLIAVVAGQPERDLGESAVLTVLVDNNVETIFPEASKKGTVYLNGVNEPASITDIKISDESIHISVEGKGMKDEERYTFNGQRILVGQKVELHGSFWAQGIITGFELR